MAVTDPLKRIEALLITAEASFKSEFMAALKAIEKSIDLDALALLLEQGRFSEAFAIVGQAAGRLGTVWATQFTAAGVSTADFLTANVEEVVIGFDQANVRAVNAMRDNQLRLVTNFTEQQRRSTQSALIAGIQEGKNPREIARIFRNSIGLTEQQARWVRNYERALRDLDKAALARELRDRRFDPSVRRAINSGEPLSEAQINKMVARYRQRALKLRSETIARTEGLRVVHEGTDEMYRQAIESGQLSADQLIREWNTAGDELVRDFANGSPTSHRTMHHQQRLVGEPFASGAGNLTMHPGAFGIGFEDINCRCLVTTRILKLSELTGAAGAFA